MLVNLALFSLVICSSVAFTPLRMVVVDNNNVRNKANADANTDADDDDDDPKRQYCSDSSIIIWIFYSSSLFGFGFGLDCNFFVVYLTCLFFYDDVNG